MAFNAGAVVVDLKADTKDFDRDMSKSSKGIDALAIAGGAAATAVAAIGAAMIKSIKSAAEFETSMSNISTLIDGDTNEAIGRFNAGIKEIAKRIPKTPEELGASAYDIVSAGISDVNDALFVLEQAARLGVGGLGKTSASVDLLTSALNAFQMDASNADKTADILFKTVKAGKTTVDQIAQSFGQVAPIASATGVSFEELQAATAALTTSGLQTSVAQTQLKALFTEMTREGGKLSKAIESVGIENTKATIESEGFASILERVKDSVDGNDVAFANLFSSVEASGAAISLTGAQSDTFKTTLDAMKDSSNSLDEAVEKQNDTFNAQWDILSNRLKIVMIELGESILPKLNEGFGVLFGENEKVNGAFSKFLGILQPVFDAIDNDLRPAIEEYNRAMAPLRPTIDAVKDAFIRLIGSGIAKFLVLQVKIIVKIVEAIAFLIESIAKLIEMLQKLRDAASFSSIGESFAKFGNMLNFSNITGRATGGVVRPGETTLVGENGPEIAQFPAGTRIIPNKESQSMMGGVTVNISDVSVRSDSDITKIANEVARVLGRDAELEALGLTTR